MNNLLFAGIGSRETPFDIQLLMYDIAAYLGQRRYILRSGGCKLGADKAFEDGCDSVKGLKEIFYPEDCTSESMAIAERLHPTWHKLENKPGSKKLLGRNPQIILGRNLNEPVGHVIYWAIENEKGKLSGGTRTGVLVARENGIKTFNLYYDHIRNKFLNRIYYGQV